MARIDALPAPSLINWPRDEAAHDGFPWEIWWISAIVRSGQRRLAPHLLLTHLGSGHVAVTVTVADLDQETEVGRRFTAEPGRPRLSKDRLETTTEVGGFEGSFEDGYRVYGELDGGDGFDLLLKATTPVLHNCGTGQFTLGALSTTQYSVAGLATSGTLRLGGQELEITGHAWYDRQWIHTGSMKDTGGAFTWFGMHLDNGDTISLWDTSMRPHGGHTWATIVRPDGTHIVTAAEPAAKGAGDVYATALGREVPRRWKLFIPALRAELEVDQRLVQDAPHMFFYTGALEVTGSYEAEPVTGYGFCDLVRWAQ